MDCEVQFLNHFLAGYLLDSAVTQDSPVFRVFEELDFDLFGPALQRHVLQYDICSLNAFSLLSFSGLFSVDVFDSVLE